VRRREFLRWGAVTAVGPYLLGLVRPFSAAGRILDLGATRLIRGMVRLHRYTVAEGSTFRFDPNRNTTLVMTGNMVVRGTLEMKPRPGVRHTLRFVGIDERKFVGGGMEVLESDVGLWVMGRGRLDIRGEPRAGWNRAGADPTWTPDDEILTTPFAPDDTSTFAPRQAQLASVSSPDGRVFTQEAFNLTRSVRIEGTRRGRAHIFIRSSAPQSILYAAVRHVGPRQGALPDDNYFVPGRYGLHFHMCGRGSVGSVVTGTVVRDCGSHAFVPHMSDGIEFSDCIAYGVNEDAYWWDAPDRSNDVRYEHCMAAKLVPIPIYRGYRLTGFNLGLGTGLVANDCVVAGNQGNSGASGFEWPSDTNSTSGLVWTMTSCVAHNNTWAGIYFWHNDVSHHTVTDFTSFQNHIGVEHGSYWNLLHVGNLLTFANGAGLVMHALSVGAPPSEYQSAYVDSRIFDGIAIVNHVVPTTGITTFSGSIVPRVSVNEVQGAPSRFDFVNCTTDGTSPLEPTDFAVTSMRPTSVYRVQRVEGTAFTVDPDGSSTVIPAFFPY
jgi:hypothetical protein